MTARQHFRALMAQRRQHRGTSSAEWQYLTRAARKLAWMINGIPAEDWTK